jgi:hypothetical protein
MSTNIRRLDERWDRLDSLPTFELAYLFDDEDDPETVTVFRDEEAHVTTNWITVDRTHAVPLEDVA